RVGDRTGRDGRAVGRGDPDDGELGDLRRRGRFADVEHLDRRGVRVDDEQALRGGVVRDDLRRGLVEDAGRVAAERLQPDGGVVRGDGRRVGDEAAGDRRRDGDGGGRGPGGGARPGQQGGAGEAGGGERDAGAA